MAQVSAVAQCHTLPPSSRQKGLPIHLMHAAFCNFTRHFHEPPLDENTTKYLTIANELCQVMPSAFDSENARRETFERYFAPIDKDLKPHIEFFLSPKVSTVTESGGRVDVAKTIDYKGGHLTVLLEEFKVESTGDAYMQICRSYEVLCEEEKNKHLLKFGNPMFLLCVLGPYIMVCGAAKRENVHVEPLTPLLPMFPGLGIESRPVQIAHCLRALKEGLDALRDFWQVAAIVENAEKKTFTDRLPEPYLVPHCPDNSLLRFGDWQGVFELPSRHRDDSNKLPSFSAILSKADDKSQYQAVVKFVYNYSGTYGTTVHQYLHSLGLAPSLYLTENLHRGLVMVVMERLSYEKGIGGWMELDTFEGKLGTKAGAIRKKLEKVIKSLQEQGMVHADLRPTNIMVKVDGNDDILMREEEPILHVVDFDWAGNVGDVCYPPFLNPNVLWPSGAKAYQKVGKNDDKILLDNWWDMFVEGREAI
ncbi:hypothetical protein CPB86DRAFT_782982 [Serendipita vermifera]|nr:hypothetical protein CPB86DRAFT_782982 [Serendipita vermifera]